METVDPGSEYAVPYFWGTIRWRLTSSRFKKSFGDQLLKQWDLVFNPEYAKTEILRHRLFRQRHRADYLALRYLGKDPSAKTLTTSKPAVEYDEKVRPDIKRFTSIGYRRYGCRQPCVSVGYGGDLSIAKTRAKEAGNGVKSK